VTKWSARSVSPSRRAQQIASGERCGPTTSRSHPGGGRSRPPFNRPPQRERARG
jgi:hypothetical protein